MTFDRWYDSLGSRAGEKSQLEVRFELSVEKLPLPRPAACPEGDGDSYRRRVSSRTCRPAPAARSTRTRPSPTRATAPLAYDVAAVVAQAGMPVTDRLVALIGVYARGFEGLNHRFIAVPFTISD